MNIDLNTFRRKTAMLLHDIEIGIGNIVIENIPNSKDIVNDTDEIPIKDLVEKAYLDDLFQILLPNSNNMSIGNEITTLKNLFIKNEIYNIRNVISHPNRPFHINYWYKVASLASDPVIDLLELDQVKKSLISAENNTIIDPPDEWVNSIFKKIPNNIPDKFEHAITGLIGRNKIISNLIDILINKLDRRTLTISLVAPGGSGKTAIILETLRKIVNNPVSRDSFEACIYITLKTQELTDEGILPLDASSSVNELKVEMLNIINDLISTDYQTFDELVTREENKKLLICIDNLETLLMEDKTEFDNLLSEIPISWKILITSRIHIDNSKIVKIEDLKKEDAVNLAKMYLVRKAGNLSNHKITDNDLSSIVQKCFFNPLAIRLTIDLYLKGKGIEQSSKIAHNEITRFSFTNLIDSFDDYIIKILECLYIRPNSSRADLRDILNFSEDQIADGIAQLSNTSLLVRVTNNGIETYKLGESISNLLLSNPRNIKIRHEIQKEISYRNKIINGYQKENNNINSIDYVDPTLPDALRILVIELNKAINKSGRNGNFHKLVDKFFSMENDFKMYPEFHIAYGRLYFEMKANDLAESKFKIALGMLEDSSVTIYYLALINFFKQEYLLAAEQFEKLYLSEKVIDLKLKEKIIDYMYRSLLYSGNYDRIIELTKTWKDSIVRGIEGSFRARAIKNNAENIQNPKERFHELKRSVEILNDVFRNDGYIKCACLQMKAIADEIAKLLLLDGAGNNKYWQLPESVELVDFMVKHIPNVNDDISYDDCKYLIDFIEYMISLGKNNLFKRDFWRYFISKYKNNCFIDGLPSDEHIEVTVEKRTFHPSGKLNKFLFAKDQNGERFFIHYNQMATAYKHLWRDIKENTKLAIIPNYSSIGQEKDPLGDDVYILIL